MNANQDTIDWVLYLERQQSLFLIASFVKPYGSMLREATGFEFVHQLHTYKSGIGAFYRSAFEMERADKFFLDIVKRRDNILSVWQEMGTQYNEIANKLIAEFSAKNVFAKAKKEYREVYKNFETILLYGTVIPYRILSGINFSIEHGADKKEFEYALDLFEPLRAETRYPQLMDVMIPYFWKVAALITHYNDHTLFSFLTPSELERLLLGSFQFNTREIEKRNRGCTFWCDSRTQNILFNYDLKFLDQIGISIKSSRDIKEVKGNIANKGRTQGKVRVINNIAQSKDFNQGDIVVSINTNPSLMAVLVKCGAIVTDEGGIMCHAAIVSRELHIPCIIGTKIATKVFKDGDMVEVDADNGVVRLIQRI